MAFEANNPNVVAERDPRGRARLIKHIGYPFVFDGFQRLARDAVFAYLQLLADALGVSMAAVEYLQGTGDQAGANGQPSLKDGLQLRWSVSYPAKDGGRVFLIQQTQVVNGRGGPAGLDVEGAGLRVVVERIPDERFAIRGIVSTLIEEVRAPDPTRVDTVPEIGVGTVDAILSSFGFEPIPLGPLDKIQAPVVLHRYRPHAIDLPVDPTSAHVKLVPGAFYPARILRFPPLPLGDPAARPWELTAWLPSWGEDAEAESVPLRSVLLVTHALPPAEGYVFEVDPVTRTGRFDALGPHAAPGALDSVRSMGKLTNLSTPAAGNPWVLQGNRVAVVDGTGTVPGGIGVAPPQNPLGPEFFYGSRTNDFAAVNAYYHAEQMVSLLDEFGIPLSSFPMFGAPTGRYRLPIRVLHRAAMFPGACQDGNCVNAQAEVLRTVVNGDQDIQLRFALADLSRNPGTPGLPIEPLGIACDARVIWHEFCHALITGATDQLEFPFAHSAGDALGAIMCDPRSALAAGMGINADDRFLSFPWGTTPSRRHDRQIEDGWSWRGPLGTDQDYWSDWRDDAGYAREQVLSSTLFRLYQAIGGDASSALGPNVPVRRRAARYAAYLIARAIHSLGPAIIVPTFDAAAFALALQLADSASVLGPAPQSRVGGTTQKVIDWAFQVQGELPLGSLGGAMPSDVYVANTVRHGGYGYTDAWEVGPEGIWIAAKATGGSDTGPTAGMQNFIFVRVANRADQAASAVTVAVYVAESGQAGLFPDALHWQQLALTGPAAAVQNQATAATPLIFGPYPWTPAATGEYKILAVVEAAGDPSNVNASTSLPCSYTPTPIGDLVPLDNNLGLRTVRAT